MKSMLQHVCRETTPLIVIEHTDLDLYDVRDALVKVSPNETILDRDAVVADLKARGAVAVVMAIKHQPTPVPDHTNTNPLEMVMERLEQTTSGEVLTRAVEIVKEAFPLTEI